MRVRREERTSAAHFLTLLSSKESQAHSTQPTNFGLTMNLAIIDLIDFMENAPLPLVGHSVSGFRTWRLSRILSIEDGTCVLLMAKYSRWVL